MISVVCFAFVDDTDLHMSALMQTTTGEELQPIFQAELDCWSELLMLTGGDQIHKILGAVLLISDMMAGMDLQNNRKHGGRLYILTDKHENRHAPKKLEVSTGLETLGVFIIMDGNQKAQIKSLTEKSKTFAGKMRAYNESFMKSIEYYMPVTYLSENVQASIIHPAKK